MQKRNGKWCFKSWIISKTFANSLFYNIGVSECDNYTCYIGGTCGLQTVSGGNF